METQPSFSKLLTPTEELEQIKKISWWKRYPNEWDFKDYTDVEQWIRENGMDKALEISKNNNLDFKQAEENLQKGDFPKQIGEKIMEYFSDKGNLDNHLRKEGRENEITEIDIEK